MLKQHVFCGLCLALVPFSSVEARSLDTEPCQPDSRSEWCPADEDGLISEADELMSEADEESLVGMPLTGNWAGRYWAYAWLAVFAMDIEMDDAQNGTFTWEYEYGCFEGSVEYVESVATFKGVECNGYDEYLEMICYVGIADSAMHCKIDLDGLNTYGAAGKVPWEPEVPLL